MHQLKSLLVSVSPSNWKGDRLFRQKGLGCIFLLGLSNGLFSQPPLAYHSASPTAFDTHFSSGPYSGNLGTANCDSVFQQRLNKNRGEGFFKLQGVRNLRPVMPGILYRSGGNNIYNPVARRANSNPLSFHTLLSLWEMGFGEVVYLYRTNYDSLYAGELNQYLSQVGITYSAMLPVSDKQIHSVMQKVHARIVNPDKGYMLIHCWNGWHMSGLISAYALMQFCGYKADRAWQYWILCTDGNYKGYEKLRTKLNAFHPYPDLILTSQQKKLYCPCENN